MAEPVRSCSMVFVVWAAREENQHGSSRFGTTRRRDGRPRDREEGAGYHSRWPLVERPILGDVHAVWLEFGRGRASQRRDDRVAVHPLSLDSVCLLYLDGRLSGPDRRQDVAEDKGDQ